MTSPYLMRPLRDEADIAYRASFGLEWVIATNRESVRRAIFELRMGQHTIEDKGYHAYMERWHARLRDRWTVYRQTTSQRERERAEHYQHAGAARALGQINQAAE